MPTRISLAEQIAQLEEATPVDFDPEDLQSRIHGAEEEASLDAGVSREHYLEVGPSTLRNRLPSVAHPKYEGVKASRKQLLEDSDEENELDEDEDADLREESDLEERMEEHEGAELLQNGEIPSESDNESEGEDSGEEEPASRLPPTQPSTKDAEREDDMTTTLSKIREEDLKKGQAVKRQLSLWDTLLDTRIRMQKSVATANRLPPPSQMDNYLQNPEYRDSISRLLREASLLSEELLDLQEKLIDANNVTQLPPRKRRRLDDEATFEEYSEAFESATEDVVSIEQALHPYVLQTLSKWSAKIQAVAPSVLLPSNRGTFAKGTQRPKSVVQLIDENLADHDKLLARTQVMRPKKPRIGVQAVGNDESEDAPDVEVFDDTDFYQKLLRDIIEARGDGNKTQDWMVLQKQRKAKKKVDTKASKGRKIRYDVHEKLQNFMVPVPVAGAWHEEQIDELFASLLGKGFETVTLNNDSEGHAVEENIELTGFRVFG